MAGDVRGDLSGWRLYGRFQWPDTLGAISVAGYVRGRSQWLETLGAMSVAGDVRGDLSGRISYGRSQSLGVISIVVVVRADLIKSKLMDVLGCSMCIMISKVKHLICIPTRTQHRPIGRLCFADVVFGRGL